MVSRPLKPSGTSSSWPRWGAAAGVSPKNTKKSKKHHLVGGWTNPSEKYESSKWQSSPNRGENKKYLKPPSRLAPHFVLNFLGVEPTAATQWHVGGIQSFPVSRHSGKKHPGIFPSRDHYQWGCGASMRPPTTWKNSHGETWLSFPR